MTYKTRTKQEQKRLFKGLPFVPNMILLNYNKGEKHYVKN